MNFTRIFRTIFFSAFSVLILLSTLFVRPELGLGATKIDELKNKIDDRTSTIKKLEQEITQYQNQIQTVGKEAQSLQNTIKTLDVTQQKLSTDILLTENKVAKSTDVIEELGIEITDKEQKIGHHFDALRQTLKNLNEKESESFIETLLTYKDLSIVWNDIETLQRFQRGVKEQLTELKDIKKDLDQKKGLAVQERQKLVTYKTELDDQKTLVLVNKKEKATILAQTKDKESNYKKILAQKVALRDAFEAELKQIESELRIQIDLSKIPSARGGVLAWPLDRIIITQYFGNTEFANAHAQLYNGMGHNGVDFGAPLGTPVKAVMDGTVVGTGNTDAVCPGASYGKWVLLQHANGLSTLYAHFSLIKAVEGASVKTGDILGYSGATGYATGPHLHFTVYATQGVRILSRQSRVCGGSYTMPIADVKAYLNPLLYLPSL